MNKVTAYFEAHPVTNTADRCDGCCFSVNEFCSAPGPGRLFACDPRFRSDGRHVIWKLVISAEHSGE